MKETTKLMMTTTMTMKLKNNECMIGQISTVQGYRTRFIELRQPYLLPSGFL